MNHTSVAILIVSLLPGTPSFAESWVKVPLRNDLCQSDIIVIGNLNVVQKSAITVTRTHDATQYDLGQLWVAAPLGLRFLKDDPWRTTVSIVDVAFQSRAAFSSDKADGKGEWIWILRRDILHGYYVVIRRMPLSAEALVKKTMQGDRCGKA